LGVYNGGEARSPTARRRIVTVRPRLLNEKIRLIDTLGSLGVETSTERADLVPALVAGLFRICPSTAR
jgi:hypothetical protein